jgi:ribosomal protein S18 acetylase RimI-like enzyme
MSHAIYSITGVYAMPERRLVRIESLGRIRDCREIQLEYIAWIDLMLKREHGISLSTDCINQLMAEIISDWPLYSGCLGRFFLAFIGKSVCGMAGIKYVSKDVCELKRLYVSPLHRRVGLGRSLVERLLSAARILGYSKVRLETLDFMEAAIRLYESLGFVRTPEFEGTEGRGYGIHDHEIYFALDL